MYKEDQEQSIHHVRSCKNNETNDKLRNYFSVTNTYRPGKYRIIQYTPVCHKVYHTKKIGFTGDKDMKCTNRTGTTVTLQEMKFTQ